MQVFIFIFVCLLFFSCFFTLDVYIEPAQSSKIIGELECTINLFIVGSILKFKIPILTSIYWPIFDVKMTFSVHKNYIRKGVGRYIKNFFNNLLFTVQFSNLISELAKSFLT